MNSRNKLLLSMVIAGASLVPTLASAQARGAQPRPADTGWYAGADIGQAEITNGPDDTALRVLGGYRVSRALAAEVGYSELLDKRGFKATALELVAVGSYPLTGQFSLIGKLGVARVELKAPGVNDDKAELTFGFGLQYDVTPRIGIRGQWQRYNTDNEVDALTVGFVYRF